MANRWNHPKAIEDRYAVALRKIGREVSSQAREQLVPELGRLVDMARERSDAIDDDDQDNSTWSGILAAILLSILSGTRRSRSYLIVIGSPMPQEGPTSWLSSAEQAGASRQSVADFGQRTNDFNLRQIQKLTRSKYGEAYRKAESLGDLMAAWERENLKLIRSIPEQYVEKLQGIVTRAISNGTDVRELTEKIRETYDQPINRAELIARDQIGKLNANITRYRQMKAGIKSYKWRGILDNRERHVHREREGLSFEWSKPPYDGHPGQPIHCFPGSTKVNGFPAMEKFYRRWYSGELTEIICDDGVVLSATPNHPILTPEGMQAISLFNEGDYVLGKPLNTGGIVDNKGQRLVPTFEQIFRALNFAGIRRDVARGFSGQFHGDGADGEVDIISTNCLLVDKVDPPIVEKLHKLGLSDTDMHLMHAFLASNRSFFESNFGGWRLRSNVGRAQLSVSIALRHLTPFEFLRFASASRFDACFNESLPDSRSVNPYLFGNSIFAFSVLIHGDYAINVQGEAINSRSTLPFGGIYASSNKMLSNSLFADTETRGNTFDSCALTVKPKRIIKMRQRKFSGHIYNLQTISGYYTANSIESSNCRCWAEPVWPERDNVKLN